MPFIPSCPGPLARTPGGYLAVVAPCRDGLDAGSVLGHHLVTAARGGAHLRARVVNKNQTDRQKKKRKRKNLGYHTYRITALLRWMDISFNLEHYPTMDL